MIRPAETKDIKVSFVIPTFNSAAWLPHAVDSALKQTHKNIEIVIINDGSTDSTLDYLHWLYKNNKEVVALTLDKVGRSKARNQGNQITQGDIICVLDADDVAAPDRAKKTIDKFNNGAEFIYGTAEVMDFSGTKIGTLPADVFSINKAIDKKTNGIVHSSVAYTRSVAMNYPYLEDKEISDNGLDDWEQQIRIASAGIKMDFIPTPIVAYRILESAISSKRDPRVVEEIKAKYLKKILIPA